ncbi:hypothetical protein SLA2020_073210 [Shorea laevis]
MSWITLSMWVTSSSLKCKPISKTKTCPSVPIPSRNVRKKKDEEAGGLGIPLESQQQQEQQAKRESSLW